MRKDIRDRLIEMAEESYRDFSKSLIPDSKPLLGVRLPVLRTLAKEIVKNSDWESTFGENEYFEEVMLEAMVAGYGCSKENNLEKAKLMLDRLVPQVDNWSVCDSMCVSYTICEKYPDEMYHYIEKYIYSDGEFEVRVGLILLLNHYVKVDAQGEKISRKRSVTSADIRVDEVGKYTETILKAVNRTFFQGYYASMAAAWLLAECFVTFPKEVYEFLKGDNKLDDFTYNKALQKICESRIPDDEVKKIIRSMKRKRTC